MRGRKPVAKSTTTEDRLTCPSFLTPDAKREWRRVYNLLLEGGHALLNIDAAVLAGYAQSFARWRESEALVTAHGVVYEETSMSRSGVTRTTLKKNPAVTTSKEAQATMLRYISCLGLSPADRTRILQDAPEPEDDISALFTPPEIEDEDAE